MALLNINYWSPSLMKDTQCNVILPERNPAAGPYPVFYLLHGLSDDYSAWVRFSAIEQHVRDLPLIVVMPDGDRAFYTDATDGQAYESAIVKDLIGFIDRHFRTIKSAKGRVIGGLSMGGYGAMKLGLKYPDKFCSLSAHSGVYLHVQERLWEQEQGAWMVEARRIYGTEKACRDNDPFALAEKLNPEKAPAIWMDCGVDDGLLRDTRALHEHLSRLNLKHTYNEFPGSHSWPYWNEHVQQALAFHRKVLGI